MKKHVYFKLLLCAVILMLPVTASASYGYATANAFIYGYDCRHQLHVTNTTIMASTTDIFNSGNVLPQINCQLKGRGKKAAGYSGSFDTGIIYSTSSSVGASGGIDAGSISFTGGESTAYFLGGIWSNLSK